jgi:ring-1,2-phenylacetyl-CoA epoxidase subunit PaaC
MTQDILQYTLHLADNALVLGHRNSEWCGHGPVLEQDIAISNIALDLIGQARNFYQYAANISNDNPEVLSNEKWVDQKSTVTEDSFPYFRDAGDFRNIVLLELPKGDWAVTVLRQFFFSAFQQLLFERLSTSRDTQIAAIAGKSLKEIAYHLRWSGEWVIRLGDGTEESRKRLVSAAEALWPYTEGLFEPTSYENSLVNEKVVPDSRGLKKEWLQRVCDVFETATISIPSSAPVMINGKEGQHSPHLHPLLATMQSVARSQPEATW